MRWDHKPGLFFACRWWEEFLAEENYDWKPEEHASEGWRMSKAHDLEKLQMGYGWLPMLPEETDRFLMIRWSPEEDLVDLVDWNSQDGSTRRRSTCKFPFLVNPAESALDLVAMENMLDQVSEGRWTRR